MILCSIILPQAMHHLNLSRQSETLNLQTVQQSGQLCFAVLRIFWCFSTAYAIPEVPDSPGFHCWRPHSCRTLLPSGCITEMKQVPPRPAIATSRPCSAAAFDWVRYATSPNPCTAYTCRSTRWSHWRLHPTRLQEGSHSLQVGPASHDFAPSLYHHSWSSALCYSPASKSVCTPTTRS